MELLHIFLSVLVLGINDALECDSGWISHDDVCYHFSHDAETWPSAETICELLGGHLAEIYSETENTFLAQQVDRLGDSYTWIGGNDLLVQYEWLWVGSNEPMGYTNWRPNEPSNADGKENCVHMQGNGLWNDRPCSASLPYICEQREGMDNVVG